MVWVPRLSQPGVVGARTTQAGTLNVYTPKRELSKDHALNRYPSPTGR
jgi:hypothetical protein